MEATLPKWVKLMAKVSHHTEMSLLEGSKVPSYSEP